MERHPDILNRELHLFEVAADMAEQGKLPAHGAAAAGLVCDYLARCEARRKKDQHAAALIEAQKRGWRRTWSYQRWSTPLTMYVVTVLVARQFGADYTVAGLCGAGFAILGYILEIPVRRWEHEAIAAAEQRCPACEYIVSGLPDSIPAAIVGVSMGPRRCPECGAPWPRVPGPTG